MPPHVELHLVERRPHGPGSSGLRWAAAACRACCGGASSGLQPVAGLHAKAPRRHVLQRKNHGQRVLGRAAGRQAINSQMSGARHQACQRRQSSSLRLPKRQLTAGELSTGGAAARRLPAAAAPDWK